MKVAAAALLVLLGAVGGCTAEPGLFPEDMVSGVLATLQTHFEARCIFLLYTDATTNGREVSRLLVLVEILLAKRGVQTAALLMHNFNYSEAWQQCKGYGPLYIILSSDSSARQTLQQRPPLAGPTWVLLLERSPIEEFFADIHIAFNCEFLVAERVGPWVRLTDVYRVAKGLPLLTKRYGTWNSRRESTLKRTSLYKRRNNLHGHIFKASVIHNPPIFILKNDSEELALDGYLYQVWRILEEKLNFRTKFLSPADSTFGSRSPNGSWSGMMGSLIRNETDLALGLLATSERAGHVVFSTPIMFISYRAFIRRPGNETLSWTSFLLPFSSHLWLLAIICCMVVSCELATLYWLGRRFGNVERGGPPVYTFSESLLCVFGALFCQQGHATSPRSLSCRIVFLLVFATGTVLISAYSAALISSLTTQRLVLPFTSLEELLQDGSYQLGVTVGSALIGILNASGGTMGEVYKRFIASNMANLPLNYQSGFHMICQNDKYTFLMPFEVAFMYQQNIACEVAVQPLDFNEGYLGGAFQKDSPYLEIIDHNIHKLRAAGILNHLRKEAWPPETEKEPTSLTAVGLGKVLPIISMLLLGVVTGILVLTVELFVIRRQRRYQPMTTNIKHPIFTRSYKAFKNKRTNTQNHY